MPDNFCYRFDSAFFLHLVGIDEHSNPFVVVDAQLLKRAIE
jgi:hypothetical protein